jgi:hypothetical protein
VRDDDLTAYLETPLCRSPSQSPFIRLR